MLRRSELLIHYGKITKRATKLKIFNSDEKSVSEDDSFHQQRPMKDHKYTLDRQYS